MGNKFLTLIIIIIFSTFVNSQGIEITEVDSIEIDPTNPEAEQLYYQQILTRLAILEQKINQNVTKDEFSTGTNFTVQTLADFTESSNTNTLLATILVIIFINGLVFAIYLYLVSQRRLAGRTIIKKEGTEWLKKN